MRSYVYHPVLNVYMQVKKYDESKKTYVCKPREDTNKGELGGALSGKDSVSLADMELKHEDISDQINVKVRALTETSQVSGLI